MLQFFKDSIRELKHVVWPTRQETQKYFVLVLVILTIFGSYLFVFSNIFSEFIFTLKGVTGSSISQDIPQATPLDIADLLISDEAPLEQGTTPEEIPEEDVMQEEAVTQ